jgi:hypothetical protein
MHANCVLIKFGLQLFFDCSKVTQYHNLNLPYRMMGRGYPKMEISKPSRGSHRPTGAFLFLALDREKIGEKLL